MGNNTRKNQHTNNNNNDDEDHRRRHEKTHFMIKMDPRLIFVMFALFCFCFVCTVAIASMFLSCHEDGLCFIPRTFSIRIIVTFATTVSTVDVSVSTQITPKQTFKLFLLFNENIDNCYYVQWLSQIWESYNDLNRTEIAFIDWQTTFSTPKIINLMLIFDPMSNYGFYCNSIKVMVIQSKIHWKINLLNLRIRLRDLLKLIQASDNAMLM